MITWERSQLNASCFHCKLSGTWLSCLSHCSRITCQPKTAFNMMMQPYSIVNIIYVLAVLSLTSHITTTTAVLNDRLLPGENNSQPKHTHARVTGLAMHLLRRLTVHSAVWRGNRCSKCS